MSAVCRCGHATCPAVALDDAACADCPVCLRAENVRLTARVEELEDRHARPGFQHLDGHHIKESVEGCVLCGVLKERDSLRATAVDLQQQVRTNTSAHAKLAKIREEERDAARAEVESLKAQLAKEQEVLNSAHLHEQIAIGERAAAEEQLRVAREALAILTRGNNWWKSLTSQEKRTVDAALSASTPKAETVCPTCKARATVGTTGVHAVGCNDSFPIPPKAEPQGALIRFTASQPCFQCGGRMMPADHHHATPEDMRRADLMRVAEMVRERLIEAANTREHETWWDAIRAVDLAAIVSEVAP